MDETTGRRLTRGDWTALLSLAVVAGAAALHRYGDPALGRGLLYAGAGALIGCVTNRIAIRALFDPWPWRGLHLPYTGVIENERSRIEEAIAEAVGGRLVTPEVLAEELRASDLPEQIRAEAAAFVRGLAAPVGEQGSAPSDELVDLLVEHSEAAVRQSLEDDEVVRSLAQELRRTADRTLRSPACYRMVRGHVQRLGGPLGQLGHVSGFADYDEVTYKVLDAVRSALDDVLGDPAQVRSFMHDWLEAGQAALRRDPRLAAAVRRAAAEQLRAGLGRAGDELERWHLTEGPWLERLVDVVSGSLDVRQVVSRALARLSTEEVKALVLRHSREHLAWLEVWGGLLGGLGGGLLYALSRWL